jgi:hypothetical protein
MFDYEKLHAGIANDYASYSQHPPLPKPDQKRITAIGILLIGNKAVKFVGDTNCIFANEAAIIHCYNDSSTAYSVFNATMTGAYPNEYTSLYPAKK